MSLDATRRPTSTNNADMHPVESAPPWRENSRHGIRDRGLWSTLWRAREVVGYLALRDLRLRYRQAVLGAVWVLAQPIAGVAVFTLVLDRLAGLGSEGLPYPLFALVGMVTWTYFSSAVLGASTALVGNKSLVTKVYFPRIAATAAALLPPGVDLAVSLGLVAALTAYYGVFAGAQLVGVVLWLGLLVGSALGVALWLSALNVRYRDVQYAVPPILQIAFFATPVVYPASSLSGWAEVMYAVNPMVGVVELGRWCLTGTPWPGWSVLTSSISAAVVLATGLAYFRRAERSFADVI